MHVKLAGGDYKGSKKLSVFACGVIASFIIFLVTNLSFIMPIKMQEDIEPWYTNVIYRRFWRHYAYAMKWMQWHRTAYWKAKAKAEEYENIVLMKYFQSASLNLGDGHDYSFPCKAKVNVSCLYNRRMRRSNSCRCPTNCDYTPVIDSKMNISQSKHKTLYNERKMATPESEEMVFEITDEMLAFLEKSDQHRQELKAQKAAEKLLEMDEKDENCEAPKEQKGARRTAEMKYLYGKQTALIHGMETAVQLHFNRNCDYNHPQLWPNIPLKLLF